MSGVQSIVDSPQLFDQIYPQSAYLAAETESRFKTTSEDRFKQRASVAFTNIVMEVLTNDLFRPLTTIPGLAARVSKGSLDVETIGKVNAVLQGLPSFTQALTARKLGGLLPEGDQKDFALRARKLLLAKEPLFLCEGAPLFGLMVGYVMRTQKMGKEEAVRFVKEANQGSLVDAIATKAMPLVERGIQAAEGRQRAAEDRSRIAKERSRIAEQRSRDLDAEMAEIQEKMRLLHIVEQAMKTHGLLPENFVSVAL